MVSSSTADSSSCSSTPYVEEGLPVPAASHGLKQEEALAGSSPATVPCWKQRRFWLILALLALLATGGAVGAVVALGLFGGDGDSDANSSTGDSNLNNGGDSNLNNGGDSNPAPSGPSGSPPPAPSVPASAPTEKPTAQPSMAPTSLTIEQFGFYLMGDVPYDYSEELILQNQIAEMNNNTIEGAICTIHVGDVFQVGRSDGCQLSYYTKTQNYLVKGPLPTLVMPGDNDWLDCPSRGVAWQRFSQTFIPFEEKWRGADLPVSLDVLNITRSTIREELFSFVYGGILFLSVHVLDATHGRQDENINWVTQHVEQYIPLNKPFDIRGVMFFGHGQRTGDNRAFFTGIAPLFINNIGSYVRRIPVMYFHGDGHDWAIDTRLSQQLGWDMFWDIQVDQGAYAPPLMVEFAPIEAGTTVPLQAENEQWQYLFANGLVRIDRRGGTY